MIPKIIHYVWVGNNEKSDKIKFCMETWKKILPDYEFREWSEKDLEKLEDCVYVKQAYNAKKYAFVSDVFRLYALYTEGGIYLDTDVEVRKSFNDFLDLDFFIGAENLGKSFNLGTAVIGAQKGNQIIKEMLSIYNKRVFVKEDKSYDMTANPILLNEIMKNYGITDDMYKSSSCIKITKNSTLFPYTYFCVDNSNSYAVHHFEGAWLDAWKLKKSFTIPLTKKYHFTINKYKNIKKGICFEYPVYMFKKFFEYNYTNKKLLFFIEKIEIYGNNDFIELIHRKIDKYFEKNFYFIAIIKIIFKLVKEYIKNIGKPHYRGKDNNIVKVLFKLYGGLGDIIIALNYIEQFKDKLDNTDISIMVPSYFYNEVKILLRMHYKISQIYTHKERSNADLVVEFVRCPVIKFADKTKILKLNSNLYNWLNTIINFNLEHKEMLNPGTVSDFLLEKYSLIQNRTRLQEGDICGFIDVKDNFKIHIESDCAKILSKFSLNEPYITLQRGIGRADNMDSNKSTRVWPIEHYENLICLLKKYYPLYKIVQIGAPDCTFINGCDFNLCGKTSFEEMLVILGNSELHIDGECGMVHLRHFINQKPSVVIFGPTNEKLYGYKENLNLSARPCPFSCEWLTNNWRNKCMANKQKTCMQQLTPEMVIRQINNYFKK